MKNYKIVDRIRALLAKAGDSASTEDEALAAAERAQRMLEEHNLTMADVVPEERDPHVTGCGESIALRLSVLSSERRREEKKTQNTYGELVVQAAALLDAYCEKVAFVTGVMRARGSSLEGGASDDGWEAGKSVSLSEQVSGSSSAHLIGR